jgi:hypothetical protein
MLYDLFQLDRPSIIGELVLRLIPFEYGLFDHGVLVYKPLHAHSGMNLADTETAKRELYGLCVYIVWLDTSEVMALDQVDGLTHGLDAGQ